MNKLSASQEDYLEMIYNMSDDGMTVKAIDIAKSLNLTRATVSEALNKLRDKNLIEYESHKGIFLTAAGETKAKSVLEKHKVLTGFFEKILGSDEISAAENACRIEHVISDDLFEKIEKFQKYCLKDENFIKDFRAFVEVTNND